MSCLVCRRTFDASEGVKVVIKHTQNEIIVKNNFLEALAEVFIRVRMFGVDAKASSAPVEVFGPCLSPSGRATAQGVAQDTVL